MNDHIKDKKHILEFRNHVSCDRDWEYRWQV